MLSPEGIVALIIGCISCTAAIITLAISASRNQKQSTSAYAEHNARIDEKLDNILTSNREIKADIASMKADYSKDHDKLIEHEARLSGLENTLNIKCEVTGNCRSEGGNMQ